MGPSIAMTNTGLPSDIAATVIINAAGTLTRLSGACIAAPVATAMAAAAKQSFDMWALQAAASRRLADITGAQAGLVTSGASAGLTLAAAACIAGLDPARMDRLPQTDAMAHEIIVPRTHRNAYDRALRVAGARLIDVGVADRETGAGIRGLEDWEVASAISPLTVAVAACASASTASDIPLLARVARRHGLPLIVDAAAQLPPLENLRRLFDLGASLVVFSGGKAIGGPQASGILAGERRLVASAALQMLDMDVRPEAFAPPIEFFDGLQVPALPRHGIGRGFKASKEAIVGLLVALDAFQRRDTAAHDREIRQRLQAIAQALAPCPGVSTTLCEGRQGTLPRLALLFDRDVFGATAHEVTVRLRQASTPVALVEAHTADGILSIDLIAVAPEDDAELVAALRACHLPVDPKPARS